MFLSGISIKVSAELNCSLILFTLLLNGVKESGGGLAVSLAAANFAANPLATLHGAIFSVWHNISGSIFASIRIMGAERKVKVSVEQ